MAISAGDAIAMKASQRASGGIEARIISNASSCGSLFINSNVAIILIRILRNSLDARSVSIQHPVQRTLAESTPIRSENVDLGIYYAAY